MATRLYLPYASAAPSFTPSVYGAWVQATTYAVCQMSPTPLGDAMTTDTSGSSAGTDRIVRSYVSGEMTAGQVIDAGIGYRLQVMATESNDALNAVTQLALYVVASNGANQKTLIPLSPNNTEVSAVQLENTGLSGFTASGSYTTKPGDRLVLEVGFNSLTHASYTASMRLGSSAGSDLASGGGQTDDYRPWFQLSSVDLTFGTLVAGTGSFTLSGQNAQLTAGRLPLVADAGAFTVAGQDATLTVGHCLDAAAGSFTVAGQDADLLATRLIDAEAGSFVLTGQDVSFVYGRFVDAEAGAFALDGQDANFIIAKGIEGGTGEFTVAGQAATLTYSGDLPPSTLPHFGDTLMWLMIDEPGGGW